MIDSRMVRKDDRSVYDPIKAWTDEADLTEVHRLGSPDDAASSSRQSAAQMRRSDL